MKRFITWFFIGLWFLVSVSAVSEYVHLTLDNVTTNSGLDDASFAWGGSASYVVGKIGSAADFDGATDSLVSSNLNMSGDGFTGSDNWAMAFWLNYDTPANGEVLFTWATGSTSRQNLETFQGNYTVFDGSYVEKITPFGTGWTHFVFQINNGRREVWVNSSLKTNVSVSGTFDATFIRFMANRVASGGFVDGQLDDVRFYNFSLSQNNINAIYNGGVGTQASLDSLTNSSVSFSVVDVDPDGENVVSEVTVNVEWLGMNFTDSNDYFINYNGSKYFLSSVYENFGFDGNASYKVNVTTPYIVFNDTSIVYDYNISYNANGSAVNIFFVGNATQNIIWSYPRLNISAVDFFNNSINNFSVSVNGSNYVTTTGGVLVRLPSFDNYSVYLNGSPTFTSVNSRNTKVANAFELLTFVNFSLFHNRALLVSFKNILSNEFIENVSVFLLGNVSYEFLTNSSLFYYYPLSAGLYDVVANKSGFTSFSSSSSVVDGDVLNISGTLTSQSEEVSVFVRNIYDQFLSDVFVELRRSSDNVLVSSGFTDSGGGIKFDLSSLVSYDIYFSKSGYDNLTGSISVVDSTYTFTLTPSVTFTPSYYSGFSIVFLPSGELVNGSVYNFQSFFNSSFWNVSSGNFSLFNGLYLVNSSVPSVNSSLGVVSLSSGNFSVLNVNTSVFSSGFVTARLTLTVTDGVLISYYKVYEVNSFLEGDASLSRALSRLGSFNKSGFSDSDRFLLTFIFILAVTFTVSGFGGFVQDEEKVLLLVTSLSFLGSWAGFLDLNFVPIEEGWILSILLGIITLFLYIKKWRDS